METSSRFFGPTKPGTSLKSLVHAWNTEGYGFIEFEISNSTISTGFRQPLGRPRVGAATRIACCYVYIYIYIYTHILICIHLCVSLSLSLYVYIYIYYTHTYHMYIHTHTIIYYPMICECSTSCRPVRPGVFPLRFSSLGPCSCVTRQACPRRTNNNIKHISYTSTSSRTRSVFRIARVLRRFG